MTNSPAAPADTAAPVQTERVVARLRPHARVLFWPTLLLITVCAATGYFSGQLPEQWETIALLSGAALTIVLLWLLPLIFWLNHQYTITTRRIIFKQGVFVRTRQELLHSRGYDLTVRRNWIQSAFRSGNVLINSGLEHPLVLKDVPKADLVQRVLHDLMESSQTLTGSRRQGQQSTLADESTFWNGR